jgi:hypothetical protein
MGSRVGADLRSGMVEVCAFDSSEGRRAACSPQNRSLGEAMIGNEVQAVLVAATRGDEEAFGRLWRDLQPRLLRYFAVAAPSAAEDLASETWLAVVRSLDRFRGNEPGFRPWGFTIARRKGARLAPPSRPPGNRGPASHRPNRTGRTRRPRRRRP